MTLHQEIWSVFTPAECDPSYLLWSFRTKHEKLTLMFAAAVIFPIALTIGTGWLARRSGLVARELWPGIETLSFRVLIPAILILAISRADLNPARIGSLALALILTLAVIGALVLLLRVVFDRERLNNPALSTLFQTSTRWNAFISLTAADLVAGAEGVLLVAVAMAVLVPLINLANIIVVAGLVAAGAGWRRIAQAIATNPIVIACLIGLAINFAVGGLPALVEDGFEIVGRAALGVGLLCVGATLEIKRFVRVTYRVLIGLVFRPLLAPLVFLGIGLLFDLSSPEMVTGVLVFVVPAASNGFLVARAMGGDAELYADLLAWQTLIAIFALPLYLALAASL